MAEYTEGDVVNYEIGDGESVIEIIECRVMQGDTACPFCRSTPGAAVDGHFAVLTATADGDRSFLTHSVPTCEEYEEMSPPAFLELAERVDLS